VRRAALVAVGVLALAGCGGKSATSQSTQSTQSQSTQTQSVQTTPQPQQTKQAYAAALVEAGKATNRDGEKAMNELKQHKPNAVADLKQSVAGFHDRLSTITPPADVETEHASLVRASAQLSQQFSAAVDAKKQKTYASLKPLTNLSRFPAGQQIVHITGQINAKGYNFG
jgi:PBP1b-binding outer membrane lipoprotein LpoB